MQNSSPWSWSNSKSQSTHSVWKIRSLLDSLNAELSNLCNRCPRFNKFNVNINKAVRNKKRLGTVSRNTVSTTVTNIIPVNKTNKNFKSIQTLTETETRKMLALPAASDPTTAVQARTLGSIYRAKVIDAYRSRRIFTVYGNYHTVRRALLRRGWLEKLPPERYPKLQTLSEDVLLQHARRGNDYEAVAISKIINLFPAFFIWQPKYRRDQHADVLPYRNRVRRGRNLDFATKVGLIGCSEQEQWYHQDGVCMSHPRFFRLGGSSEERVAFIEDFRSTQCRCLLRYIMEHSKDADELCDNAEGAVNTDIIQFAVARLKKQLCEWDETGLDNSGLVSNSEVNCADMAEWANFFLFSNMILQKKGKFKADNHAITESLRGVRGLMDKLEEKRPDYKWDGVRNLWILKPGYQCRGIGIIIRNSLEDILLWATNNSNRRYIAQKYVERPLLIYKTKFDIRQYMLLSIGVSSVSIWMYKDCYLRFSSQEFSMEDLREAIHLTNNSVQKKYKNKQTRDTRLPKNNMWSLEQFKVYLKHNDVAETVWEKIFNGFKANLIAVVMASLEDTEIVENAFELYGCDFMLDEEYNPILIEINATPDLTPSTEVTAHICPNALKDLVKVIVDLPRNPRASTGMFELVYDITYKFRKDSELSPENPLDVKGHAVTLHKPIPLITPRPFLKKPIKIVKKAEAALKIPYKKLKRGKTDKKSEDNQDNLSIDSKGLKAFAKEALAIRYTLPK